MSWFVFVLFFVSGACGLIYEVVWSRMLALVFGRSILAVGTVLAAFMSGLAIGSYVLGRIADKSRNPFRLYGLYELGIGLAALIASLLLPEITPLYLRAHALFGEHPVLFGAARLSIAFGLLIVPTALMGATLPVLSRVVIVHLSRVGLALGRLYAVNTVGAVAGTFMAGFYLIGHFGLHGAVYIAVIGNIAIGLFAWFASARPGFIRAAKVISSPEGVISPNAIPAPEMQQTYRLALWIFALSGVTSFAYEIFWTRSLVFILGNTTYAFSLMLVAFLSGIALGGYGMGLLVDRVRSPLRLFALIEVLIGIISASSLPLLFFIVTSESVHSFITRMSDRFGFLILSDFALALVLMLLPAILIGSTLPLLSRIFVKDLHFTGSTIGKVYSVNTMGNIAGALLPGLVIMPIFGIQKGILLMAALNICLGVVLLLFRPMGFKTAVVASSVMFMAAVFGLTRTSTPFQFPSEFQSQKDEVLFYREGGLVTTKVWENADTGYKIISVDGIGIGGTSDSDYKQQILAHLPKLLLKRYQSELSIGLGSGILVGESARHAALKRIVTIEISKGVLMGSNYFLKENFNILNDPRAVVVINDAIDYLRTTNEHFDIISADEKTTGKYATNSLSYSQEYYALLKRHLAPGGLAIQWVPADLPPSQYALVLRTFLDSFPRVMLWYFPPVGRFSMSNTFLVGSNERIDIDPQWMRQTMESDPGPFQGIRKYGLTTAEAVLAHYIAGDELLRRAVPAGPVNSFEHPYYEFYSPGEYAVPSNKRAFVNYSLLMSVRGPDFGRLPVIRGTGADSDRLKAAYRAEGKFLEGHGYELSGSAETTILPYYTAAIEAAPWDTSLRNEVVSYLNAQVRAHYFSGDITGSLAFLRQAAEIYPESVEALYDYGMMLWFTKQVDPAVKEFEQSLMLDSGFIPSHRMLGTIYVMNGQVDAGLAHWKEALILDPGDVLTLVRYGVFLAEQGAGSQAEEYLRRAYQLNPANPNVIDGYARVLYLRGDLSGARHIILTGGDYYKGNRFFEELRSNVLGRR